MKHKRQTGTNYFAVFIQPETLNQIWNLKRLSDKNDVIVTSSGGILTASSRENPWIDSQGENHENLTCAICLEIQDLCAICLADTRLGTVSDVSTYLHIYSLPALLLINFCW